MAKSNTNILAVAALGALLFITGAPSVVDLPFQPVGKAFAGNGNGNNGNGNGNSGNSGKSGNSGGSNSASSANSDGSSGNNGNANGGGHRGQSRKAEVSATSRGIGNVASSKMKPKEIYAKYGIHPSDAPGGWMGALMGNMKLKASGESVHGRAQAALATYEAAMEADEEYQDALAALGEDEDLAALDPTSAAYDDNVAALATTKISELEGEIAALPTDDPTIPDLEAEKDLWQDVLDTQTAAQDTQATYEQAFEDVTHGQTPYNEPLAENVMTIYQNKFYELSAADGG